MANNHRYPRMNPQANVVVGGAVWNQLVDDVEAMTRLDVAPPLFMQDNAGGKLIAMCPPPPPSRTLQITGIGTGTTRGAGFYEALILGGTPSGVNANATLMLPNSGETAGTQKVILENDMENGGTGHLLATDGSAYVEARPTGGTTNDSHPLAIWRTTATPPGARWCTLTQNGGANSSTPAGTATYTYTLTDKVSGAIVTPSDMSPVGPTWARPVGVLTGPGANGMYQYVGGTLYLLFTDEQQALVSC